MRELKLPARLRAWAVGAARGDTKRPVLQAAHRAVVGAEIAAAQAWASRNRVEPADPGNLTLVIKTFERPQTLRRMLASVRKVYAGPVIIADDSQVPHASEDPLVGVLRLPFDSGIGAGRNAVIDAVTTEYLWMADDDMILLPDFDIGRVLYYLARNPQVDLVGGKVVNLPQLRSASYLSSDLFAYEAQPIRPLGTMIDGLPVAYKVPNWYVARAEKVRSVRYDDRLKRVDHKDFFSSAYGRLLCVLDAKMVCLHAHSYFDPHYLSFRQDTAADFAYLAQKWGSRGIAVAHAEQKLDDQQRRVLHHAAVQVVASDLGVEIVHDGELGSPVLILVVSAERERLVEGLLALGWRRASDRLTSRLWGDAEVRSVADFDQHRAAAAPASFASVPGLATQPHAWPQPVERADLPANRRDWIRWSDRAGWLDAGEVIIAAALPVGPYFTLTTPGDLIWEVVGADGGETDSIIAAVLDVFDEVPDGAQAQIGDYLDLLISRGLLERV